MFCFCASLAARDVCVYFFFFLLLHPIVNENKIYTRHITATTTARAIKIVLERVNARAASSSLARSGFLCFRIIHCQNLRSL